VNSPFHGPNPKQIYASTVKAAPGGLGTKRWFEFVTECHNLDSALYIYDDKNPEHIRALAELGTHASGVVG
jgi:hypothetical protein